MKKTICSVICALLCAALLSGSVMFALAGGSGDDSGETASKAASEAVTGKTDYYKTETVYVIADASGNAQKIIVGSWIKNDGNSDAITDKSDLTGITNVKGDESCTQSGDVIVWNASGNDIYYRGTSEKELPVDVKITYKLDGKEISASDLAGKSGAVTIRFDYTNKQYETVEIDGEKEKIYVPFLMLSGLMLDNDVFSDVSVTNGKVINDGSRSIAVGVALPGLQSDLDIDASVFEIPDYVEIQAKTSGFKLAATLTVAACGIPDGLDTSSLDGKADSLKKTLSELGDASEQLRSAAETLAGKTAEFAENLDTVVGYMNELDEGVKKLASGSGEIAEKSVELHDGLYTIQTGLGKIVSKSDELNAGADKVFTTLLSEAGNELSAAGLELPGLTKKNYASVLASAVSSLSEESVRKAAAVKARAEVSAKVEAAKPSVKAQITAGYGDAVLEGVLKAAGYSFTAAQYRAAADAGLVDSQRQAMVTSAVDAKLDELTESQCEKLIEENLAGEEVKAAIEKAVSEAAEGVKKINALKNQLDDYSVFCAGLKAYTDGVGQAYGGVQTAGAGAEKLSEAIQTLNAGIARLSESVSKINDGVSSLAGYGEQLSAGEKEFSEKLGEFCDEGISKLIETGDTAIGMIETRLHAVIDVAKDYKTYSGLADGADGQVRFVYRTAAIGED